MPFVPSKHRPPSNDLTLKLFKLIDEEGDNSEAIETLLQASTLLASTEKLRTAAINFAEAMDSSDPQGPAVVTPLDLTIVKDKSQNFDQVCNHIFECDYISSIDKNTFLNAAIMRAIYLDKINYLFKLLEKQPGFNLTLKQNLVYYTGNNARCSSPITVAVGLHRFEALSVLLMNNADPAVSDSQNNTVLSLAVAKPADHPNKAKMISMIECAIELQSAIKAFEAKDAALTYKHVSAALQLDQMFMRNYLKTIAWRAVSQLSNPLDGTDYRFVLEFSRIFTIIVRSTVNSNRKYVGESEFQNDVIVHLIGAYDCDKKDISPNIQKLFNTNKEKLAYFNAPITGTLIQGANVGSTLGTMVERKSLNPSAGAEPQAAVLAVSMARGEILSTPGRLPLAEGSEHEDKEVKTHSK